MNRSQTWMVARKAWTVGVAALVFAAVPGCEAPGERNASAQSTRAATTDPMAEDAQNVRLVGHNDLQGRTALVVTTKSDPANGNWVYVGHHDSFRDEKPLSNPITGKMEFNGTSILETSDPSKPRLVWHIPNETNRNSRGVSVVYDYSFDGSGRDYLIRNSEALTQGETGKDLKYQIFDITTRDSDPSKIALVAEISGTPPNSCGRGCGGPFIMRAHKGWWSQSTGYFYAASGEPGFRNVIVQIFDLKNPKQPKLVGRAWIPGLKDGEPGYEGGLLRHFRSGTAEVGVVARHEPATPRTSHRLTHRVRQGAQLRSQRAAAYVCLYRRRSRGRRRHETVHERRALGDLHGRHHDRDEAVSGLGLAGAGG
ncbi:MAG: hypothetical protein LC791_19150 [Acidobacteria bacterium]|nr:hypothetical protein [Acidobacteriota bacterium]